MIDRCRVGTQLGFCPCQQGLEVSGGEVGG